jgi:outer membrane protein assembly factor BamB
LQCFDAATGKLAWEKELNTLDIRPDLTPEEKAEIKTILAGIYEYDRKWYTARFEFGLQTPEGRTRGMKLLQEIGAVPADTPTPETFKEAIKVPDDPVKNKEANQRVAKLGKIGWRAESWHPAGYASGLMCIGYSFPTPVTDGERIYIATGYDTFWCFDLDGKIIWGMASPGSTSGDFCNRAKSPILYKNLMISDLGDRIRFIDKTNGKVVFMAQTNKGGHGMSTTPVIIRVSETDILLCAGKDDLGGLSEIFAFRLPDGKAIPIKGWSNPGGSMLVKYDAKDTVFFIGGGEHGGWEKKAGGKTLIPGVVPPPAAVKFALSDDTLNATVLWSGIEGGGMSKAHSGILYHDGKLHVTGYLLDANTGKILAGKPGRNPGASARGNHMQIANGLIYGLASDGTNGKMEVFSLDGKSVANNNVPSAKVEGEKREQIRSQNTPAYGPDDKSDRSIVAWRWFSYSCPFMIHDDSIFIRSNDELWCIGQK